MGPSFHFSVPQPPGLEGCSFFGPQIRSKFSPEKKKLPIISKSKNYGPEMQVWIHCKIRHTLLSKEQRKERGDGSRRDDRTGASHIAGVIKLSSTEVLGKLNPSPTL